VWHRVGEQPTLPAVGANRRVTVFGSTEALGRGRVEVVVCAGQDSACFLGYLRALDDRREATGKEVFLVLDNNSCHTSRASRTALAEREEWLRVIWLARYSPHLNPKESTNGVPSSAMLARTWLAPSVGSWTPSSKVSRPSEAHSGTSWTRYLSGSSPVTAKHRPEDRRASRKERRTRVPASHTREETYLRPLSTQSPSPSTRASSITSSAMSSAASIVSNPSRTSSASST
jgi:hypothetical protein